LVDLVLKDHITISQAGKELSIKYPTAKGIMQNYYRTGKLTKKSIQADVPKDSPEESVEGEDERRIVDGPDPNMAVGLPFWAASSSCSYPTWWWVNEYGQVFSGFPLNYTTL
jgi:hypothetical protein